MGSAGRLEAGQEVDRGRVEAEPGLDQRRCHGRRAPAIASRQGGRQRRGIDRRRAGRAERRLKQRIADPRVEPGVGEVGGEVARQRDQGRQHQRQKGEVEVAAEDRVVDQLAHAEIGEGGLDHEGTREQRAERQRDHGHDRQHGVRQAHGACSTRTSLQPRPARSGRRARAGSRAWPPARSGRRHAGGQQGEGQHRQGEVAQPVQRPAPVEALGAARGQPAELDREQDDQQHAQPERGHGEADDGQQRDAAIEQPVRPGGGPDARRAVAMARARTKLTPISSSVLGSRSAQHLGRRHRVEARVAEIAVQPRAPASQPSARPAAGRGLRSALSRAASAEVKDGSRLQHQVDRVAGHQADQAVDQERDGEQDERRSRPAADQKAAQRRRA